VTNDRYSWDKLEEYLMAEAVLFCV